MKMWLEIDSLDRIGDRLSQIWDILSAWEAIAPISPRLPQNEDEGNGRDIPVDRNALLAMGRERRGVVELSSRVGVFGLSWSYHQRAWFQSLTTELNIGSANLATLVTVTRELSELLCSAYSVIDRYDVREPDIQELSNRNGRDDPWDCLDDLYWYNYFGPDLRRTLRDTHGLKFDVGGLSQTALAHGWEVRIDGNPSPRPRPPLLQQYLAAARVFRRYNPDAHFRGGRISFDYSKVRQA